MKFLVIALIPLLFLTGCFKTVTGSQGLTVPQYTKAQRQAVHAELTNPSCPVPATIEFMKDYKVLRDQARVK